MTKALNEFLLFLNEQNEVYSVAVLHRIVKGEKIAVLPKEFEGRPCEYLLNMEKELPKMKQN